jgi:hypothetical protein
MRRRTARLGLVLAVCSLAGCGSPTSPSSTPQVGAVTPPTGTQGSTVSVTLTGSQFTVGDTAAVTITGAGVTVSDVHVRSATTAAATLTIAADAPPGPRTLTLTTATEGASPALTFTVVPPAPTLTAIAPTSAIAGTIVNVTLTGKHFVQDKTSVVVSGTGITVRHVTVQKSTSLTAELTIDATAQIGAHSVTVQTDGGTSAARIFTITAPPIASIAAFTASPSRITNGQSSTLSWSGIANATTCSIDHGVGDVACSGGSTSVRPTSTTTYTLTAVGAGGSATATATVSVSGGTPAPAPPTAPTPPPGPKPPTAPAPTLSSITPNSGESRRDVDVMLVGTNFVAGQTAVNISGKGVSVSRIVIVGNTMLTARFTIKKNAESGARGVTVTTAGGTSNTVTFTVTSPR